MAAWGLSPASSIFEMICGITAMIFLPPGAPLVEGGAPPRAPRRAPRPPATADGPRGPAGLVPPRIRRRPLAPRARRLEPAREIARVVQRREALPGGRHPERVPEQAEAVQEGQPHGLSAQVEPAGRPRGHAGRGGRGEE